VHTGQRITSLEGMDPKEGPLLCDVTPRQFALHCGRAAAEDYRKANDRISLRSGGVQDRLRLSAPIPWTARECYRAITVHLGGTLGRCAFGACGDARRDRREAVCAGGPAVVVRRNAGSGGKAHSVDVLSCSERTTEDMTSRIEAQLERFAPGFQDCVLERRVSNARDARIDGCEFGGGDIGWRRAVDAAIPFSSRVGGYYTGTRNLYLLLVVDGRGWRRARDVRVSAARMAVRRLR